MGYTLYQGDCLEVMPTLEANSVDTVITDPPYGLGFMGKHWDHGVPGVQFWREALRVAKPGAMLLAFGGTRTFHRLTCAIEDAGWEIRDCVTWLYGSGFPKSLDISKAIDKAAGAEREIIRSPITMHSTAGKGISNELDERPWLTKARENGFHEHAGPTPATPDAATWAGWGTALKPAWEPVILAMKPLDGTFAENALAWGVAGLNVDGARIGYEPDDMASRIARTGQHAGESYGHSGNVRYSGGEVAPVNPAGRWPANLLLDEDAAAALDAQSGTLTSGGGNKSRRGNTAHTAVFGTYNAPPPDVREVDTGGASRFFYVAKASRAERNAGLEGMEAREKGGALNVSQHGDTRIGRVRSDGAIQHAGPVSQQNHHPTVKPLALMRYLCRLTSTPTGGVVLDPFMGSGTTGVACMLEGRQFVGIDLDPHYCAIAERRIAMTQPALIAEDCEIHP